MPPPRNIVRKVLLGLVILSFLLALGATRRPRPPEVAADCTRASFELTETSVPQAKPVAYTIVGPAGRLYAIGVDTSTFELRDGAWRGVPERGAAESMLEAAPAAPMPDGCVRTGFFATPIPYGDHTVTLYELTPAGAVFVEQQKLEVTEPTQGLD